MRVFIVEDDKRLLDNLRVLIDGEPGLAVSGTASSVKDARASLGDSKSDILLSDLGLPDGSGVDLIREAKRAEPGLEILAYTVFDDRDTVFAALKAGASGYLLKGSTPRQLVEALTNVALGGSPMSPRIARKVVLEFRDDDADEEASRPEPARAPGAGRHRRGVFVQGDRGGAGREPAHRAQLRQDHVREAARPRAARCAGQGPPTRSAVTPPHPPRMGIHRAPRWLVSIAHLDTRRDRWRE